MRRLDSRRSKKAKQSARPLCLSVCPSVRLSVSLSLSPSRSHSLFLSLSLSPSLPFPPVQLQLIWREVGRRVLRTSRTRQNQYFCTSKMCYARHRYSGMRTHTVVVMQYQLRTRLVLPVFSYHYICGRTGGNAVMQYRQRAWRCEHQACPCVGPQGVLRSSSAGNIIIASR